MNPYQNYRVGSHGNTGSVQSFIRMLAFVISFIVLFIVIILPLSLVSTSSTGSALPIGLPAFLFSLWVASFLSKMFYILPEWQTMVILRLGKYESVRGAGFFIIPPFIYSVADIIDMRIVTQQVEATATLTKDNVPTKVTAAVEFKVEDPRKATMDVQNYHSSVIWLSTEALKNTIGSMDLKSLLSERDQIADNLKMQIDHEAAIYGVDVRAVRITDIDTPASLVDELAVIAREQRAAEAKKVQAEAEIAVAEKIEQASALLEQSKYGMRLRELQILSEMSKEESSMVIIYPYGDRDGENIAQAAGGSHANTHVEHLDEKQAREQAQIK